MENNELLYKIALSIIPGIGGVHARKLLSFFGSPQAVFRESTTQLTRIPGIGETLARRIKDPAILKKAGEELDFTQKHRISVFFCLDDSFPLRFRECEDAPVTFFYKGNGHLDSQKAVAVVGTRHSTEYGRKMCESFIIDLAASGNDLLIVSGLAYGIDIVAHKTALKYGIPTIGVLGHGLDTLYPSQHTATARDMVANGGLLTDFPSRTKIDPSNFIRRNRLIAGLAQATVVIESGEKGGAIITAEIAASYNRDVFAFPGRSTDTHSKGCNLLIRDNVAALIESAEDFEKLMGWQAAAQRKVPASADLFDGLSGEELRIACLMKPDEKISIDTLCQTAGLPVYRVSPILLNLEFKGIVAAFPGNVYGLR